MMGVPSVLLAGDTLASLAQLYKLDPVDLAAMNGVQPSPRRARDCTWGRAVEAWVLRTGGFRHPVVASSPNVCAPGLGFAAFKAGQVINLPAGGPRRPVTASPSPTSPLPKKAGLGLLALLLIGGAYAATR